MSQNNATTIEKTLTSIVTQDCPVSFEIILVNCGTDKTVEIAQAHFPHIRTVKLNEPALPGRARNAGVKISQGDYLSFPSAHIELAPGSLRARVKAHQKGYAMVSGAMVNGTLTSAGWASYFVDHSEAMPLAPSKPLQKPPSSCSYEKNALNQSGLFPEDRRAGEDTFVNQALWDLGYRAYRNNKIILKHRSRCTTAWALACHHFVRGRAYGQILFENEKREKALLGYTRNRFNFIEGNVAKWGGEMRNSLREISPLGLVGSRQRADWCLF
ncbi:MAG: glycosyltransferase [Pseudoruegeria sp.]